MKKAAGIMYLAGDEILLAKRNDDFESWAFPGGKLEKGETEAQAAGREFKEETGKMPPEGKQFDYTEGSDYGFTTFIVKGDKFDPLLNNEHSRHMWAKLDLLPSPLHPGVKKTLEKYKAMSEEKQNISQFPRIFYCRHMQPGLCRYDKEMLLVDTDAMKRMIPTGIGRPVFIGHQKVNLAKIKENAAGWIADSFYNELDGWAWFKFLAIDDECHMAVLKDWSVSNAYLVLQTAAGGTKNNCPYDRELLNGEFTHVAIVPDPRYEGALILSPEDFKIYQEKKKSELEELHNSKTQKGKPMLSFFKMKKEPTTNIDKDTMVELENGKTVSVEEMINSVTKAAEAEEKKKEEKLNSDQMVECGKEKMPLKELVNRYMKMNSEKKNDSDSDKEEDEKDKKEKKNKSEKKNESDEDDKKKESKEKDDKENSDDDEDEKEDKKEKKNAKEGTKFFEELRNAHLKNGEAVQVVETGMDKTDRGKVRYGSANG